MFDAHCHLDFEGDAAETVWHRARTMGIASAVMAGVDPDGWKKQRSLCQRLSGLWRTVGLHPWVIAGSRPEEVEAALESMRLELSHAHPEVVGLGETGLDRSKRLDPHGDGHFELQIHAFGRQLGYAREFGLPLVLHIVRAHGLALDMIRQHGPFEEGGMIHSFGGSAELAREWTALGFDISVSPQVTRAPARKLRTAIATIPIERLLIETDSPDQLEDPTQLHAVLDEVAAARNVPKEEIAAQTTRNARRLFGLGPIS